MQHISRRQFIQTNLVLASAGMISYRQKSIIQTVNGPIGADKLGRTLVHEHILVDFIGADAIKPGRYNPEEVFQKALPYLQQVKQRGFSSLVDCTPEWLGRDAALLKRLSTASGLHILTNTGWYGAVSQKYLPSSIKTISAEELSKKWINEFNNGIDNTGIRPGFMKLGLDDIPFTPEIEKVLTAAALTHLATGLTIGVHTSKGGQPAIKQLEIWNKLGVHPSAWIWIHAQNEKDHKYHIDAAKRGAWVSFDGVSKDSIEQNTAFLSKMKEAGLLNKALISQDAGWYNVGDPNGGKFRDFNDLPDLFIPALLKSGFSQQDIDQLTIKNPAFAFAIKK